MTPRYQPDVAYGIDKVREAAAELTRLGTTIVWEPGDGTRYELTLVAAAGRRFLLGTSVKFLAECPEKAHRPEDWARKLPRGSWPGLRPLLVAAGMAWGHQELELCVERDRRQEAAARADVIETLTDAEVLSDAKLGAAVRHMLGARGMTVPGDPEL